MSECTEYQSSFRPISAEAGEHLWKENYQKREELKKASEIAHSCLVNLGKCSDTQKRCDNEEFPLFSSSTSAKASPLEPKGKHKACIREKMSTRVAKDPKPSVGIEPFIPFSSSSCNDLKPSYIPMSPYPRPQSAPIRASDCAFFCNYVGHSHCKKLVEKATKCLLCFRNLTDNPSLGPFLAYGSYDNCKEIGKKKTFNVHAPTRCPNKQIHEHALLTWRKNHSCPHLCSNQNPHHYNCGCEFILPPGVISSPPWQMEV